MHASRFAERIVATDISERALRARPAERRAERHRRRRVPARQPLRAGRGGAVRPDRVEPAVRDHPASRRACPSTSTATAAWSATRIVEAVMRGRRRAPRARRHRAAARQLGGAATARTGSSALARWARPARPLDRRARGAARHRVRRDVDPRRRHAARHAGVRSALRRLARRLRASRRARGRLRLRAAAAAGGRRGARPHGRTRTRRAAPRRARRARGRTRRRTSPTASPHTTGRRPSTTRRSPRRD